MAITDTAQRPHVTPFIDDKAAYLGACALIQKHGSLAPLQACKKARLHDKRGEKLQSLYWRRVERATEILMIKQATGYLH